MSCPKLIVTGLRGLIGSYFSQVYGEKYDLVSGDIVDGIDLTDRAQLKQLISDNKDAKALIHLAAFTNVSAAHDQRGDEDGLCYRLNVTGTKNVVQECGDAGIPLVHLSTDFVFDGKKKAGYDEDDTPNPIEWYGETKFLAEGLILESGIPATILRIAFPYLPSSELSGDLVAKIQSKLRAGETCHLFTDQLITPTYAGDIVDAMSRMALQPSDKPILHVTGLTSLSPYELGREVALKLGLDTELVAPTSMEEFLKLDPRPRQKWMRMISDRYAESVTKTKTLSEGLELVMSNADLDESAR